jgi:hypothetical protein
MTRVKGPDGMTDEELTKFGVTPDDEGPHAFDPAVEWWNESWFWDWFDAEGRVAGHCRIGIHPSQGRAWVWFFLKRDDEWIAVEQPRLPLSDLKLPELAYDRWGLRFRYEVQSPLRRGRLWFDGFGRVLGGPRGGMVLPVGADLEISALGAPHSPGRARARGHESETYPASRFEQPIALRGTLRIDDTRLPFEGRGERDHSWGPRPWNMEWTVVVLNGEDLRLQCHEALIPQAGRFAGGYLHREDSISLRVGGPIEIVSAAEIDLSHVLVPPQRSIYRRALIRVHRDTGGPLLGWMELHRLRGS